MTTTTELFPGANLLSESDRRFVMEQAEEYGLKIMPPVECYPFCSHGDGHPGRNYVSDQTCFGVRRTIPTTVYPPVEVTRGQWEQDSFAVFAQAPHDGERATVHVGLGENVGLEMLPAEARQVAAALLAAADELESAGAVR